MNPLDLSVRTLSPDDTRIDVLVPAIVKLTNDVYADAESGMWQPGATRTSASEVASAVAAREMIVAEHGPSLAGSIRMQRVGPTQFEFGMLCTLPAQRRRGVGKALIAHCEEKAREAGASEMQLQILVPRSWKHPSKEFLKAWYPRLGYRLLQTGSFSDAYPQLVGLLATECDFLVYGKALSATTASE